MQDTYYLLLEILKLLLWVLLMGQDLGQDLYQQFCIPPANPNKTILKGFLIW